MVEESSPSKRGFQFALVGCASLFSKWALSFEQAVLQKPCVRFFVCQGRVRQEEKDMHQGFRDKVLCK